MGCLTQLFCKCDLLIVSKMSAFTFKMYFLKYYLVIFLSLTQTPWCLDFICVTVLSPALLKVAKNVCSYAWGGSHLPKCRSLWEAISLRTSVYHLHQHSKCPAHIVPLSYLCRTQGCLPSELSTPPPPCLLRWRAGRAGRQRKAKCWGFSSYLEDNARSTAGTSSPVSLGSNSRQSISLASPQLG